jgi:hypothetical protein
MLVGFKSQFPTETPRIEVATPELKATWLQVCKDMGVKSEIVLAKPKHETQLPEPTPAPAAQTTRPHR